jgi:hypothetical protein
LKGRHAGKEHALPEIKKKRGRPSTYSAKMSEAIWERLIEGQSLRQICCDDTMPGRRTVFQWLAKYPEFARLYTNARSAQIHRLYEEMIDIADNEPDLRRARVMINARSTLIGRLKAKKNW